MSIKLVSWVLDNYENDDCSQWKVMVALAEWAGPEGVCFPSIASISIRLGRSKRQTQRVLEALASSFDIVIIPPEKAGRGYYNAYLVVGDKTPETVSKTLKSHRVIDGRLTDAEIAKIADALIDIDAREAPTLQGEPPDQANRLPDNGAGKRPKSESLFEGEFTPEKELEMLLGGVVEHPARWDPGEVKKLQTELERVLSRQGKGLSDSHRQLAILFRYATGWDYPTKSRWGQWTKGFQDHTEIFGDPLLIAELYQGAALSLLNSQKEARGKGRSFNVPPHPTSLTKTMEAIHAEQKTRERAKKPAFAEGDVLAKITNPRKGA